MQQMKLGYSDSNQEKQDQNLLCYHYTIAQNQRTIVIFLFWRCKGTTFLEHTKHFGIFFFPKTYFFSFFSFFQVKIFGYTENQVYLSYVIYRTLFSIFKIGIIKRMNETTTLIEKIIEGIQEKKGKQIVVADLNEIEDTICKYFIICQATLLYIYFCRKYDIFIIWNTCGLMPNWPIYQIWTNIYNKEREIWVITINPKSMYHALI